MKTRLIVHALILLSAWLVAFVAPVRSWSIFSPPVAMAQQDWETEFAAVCSGTDDAMTFTTDELRSLVGRCDALKTSIDRLGEPRRKILLKRLQMCRDLYAFTLEAKEQR